MSMRTLLLFGLQSVALTILLFVCFVVASPVLGPQEELPPEQAAGAAAALVAVCFLNAVVLAYVIARSRWSGWRLVAMTFVVLYGVTTVMPQLESAVFITRLPAGTVPRLFLMGAVIAALFAPPAVLVMGKMRRGGEAGAANARLSMPAREWAWKLAAIALAYLVLYFGFGYFVAWQNPAVREYYGGGELNGFAAAMIDTVRDRPWLPAFQVLRALLWAALAAPVIRMTRGRWWEAGLSVALLFAVVMNAQLLLPNPYMPEPVRMTHLVETASSNFLFGWLVVWLLHRHHSSLPDLFGARRENRHGASSVRSA